VSAGASTSGLLDGGSRAAAPGAAAVSGTASAEGPPQRGDAGSPALATHLRSAAARAAAAPVVVNGFLHADVGASVAVDPERGVSRSRRVSAELSRLRDAEAGPTSVHLPLFSDVAFDARLRAAKVRADGTRVWNGAVEGQDDSSVVLVEHGGVLSGYVAAAGASYRIRPGDGGASVVEELDASAYPEKHEHPQPPAAATSGGAAGQPAVPATAAGQPVHVHADGQAHIHLTTASAARPVIAADGAPVVDLIVGYTTAAKNAKGGQVGIESDIALAVEQTNAAFETSGVNATLRLTRAVEVPSNGDVTNAYISKLANGGDGWNDSLNVLRDGDGADLVALIVDDNANQACGMAYQMSSVNTSFSSYAVSLTDVHCSTGNLTFTHELGHNFGAAHDRGSWAGTPAYPYGYDWVNSTAKWRTVMAYTNACSGCTRLLRFSNPDQDHNGAPVGSPIGTAKQADNRALLNATAPTVASFRGDPVPASLTVTGPAENARVTAPSRVPVTWSSTGNVGSAMKLELLRGSSVVATMATSTPSGVGSYAWTVPATLARATDYTVRVSSVAVPSLNATSAPFAVVDPTLTVTSPTGGQSWTVATPQRVTWTHTGLLTGSVKVELTREGRTVATLATAPIGAGGSGSAAFSPLKTLGAYSDYRIKVTAMSFAAASDYSDDLTLTGGPSLQLSSPAAEATWTAGTSRTVTWSATGTVGTTIRVELLKGGVVAAVIASAAKPAAGSVTWTAPATLPTGADYRVRVVAPSNAALFDSGEEDFSIDGTSLTLGALSGDGPWVAGSLRTITWTRVGAPGTSLRLELVRPGATPVLLVAATPLASGTYTVKPALNVAVAGDYRIRGTVVGNVLVADTTDEDVAITRPSIVVTDPEATWTLGSATTLQWAFTGTATAPVKLELVRGTKATVLASSVPTAADGTGSYTVRPAQTLLLASDYRLRVTATSNAAVTATSTGLVELRRPTLAVTSAAAPWTTGGYVSIDWQFSDAASTTVRAQLLRGTTVVATLPAGATNGTGAGTVTWKVPSALAAGSYTLRLRPSATASTAAVEAQQAVTVVRG
jgi:hypothetical protein